MASSRRRLGESRPAAGRHTTLRLRRRRGSWREGLYVPGRRGAVSWFRGPTGLDRHRLRRSLPPRRHATGYGAGPLSDARRRTHPLRVARRAVSHRRRGLCGRSLRGAVVEALGCDRRGRYDRSGVKRFERASSVCGARRRIRRFIQSAARLVVEYESCTGLEQDDAPFKHVSHKSLITFDPSSPLPAADRRDFDR